MKALFFVVAAISVALAQGPPGSPQGNPLDELADATIQAFATFDRNEVVSGSPSDACDGADSAISTCMSSIGFFRGAQVTITIPSGLLNGNIDCAYYISVWQNSQIDSTGTIDIKVPSAPTAQSTATILSDSIRSETEGCASYYQVVKGSLGSLDSGVTFTSQETTDYNSVQSKVEDIKALLASAEGEGEGDEPGEGEGQVPGDDPAGDEGGEGGDGGMSFNISFIVSLIIIVIVVVIGFSTLFF
uniref:Uncharacterized protein n=1 Tax=Palpitomonas bilix TaxID=652834 RepID=A0A7S3FZX1_9EUKA|mmetsp:Transcript_10416/g.27293  ORF Transcript_10416/g.27293 Transcript_10416/m.27293 type:complete len:245 (+) Transcript_10416:123-857(+)